MATTFITTPIDRRKLITRMLIGAAIGLLVILRFVLGVNHPHPNWGQFWMIRPLLVTPLAGAAGGTFNYFTDALRKQGGWKSVAAITLSLIVFLIGLWMGIVLGLAGTLWH